MFADGRQAATGVKTLRTAGLEFDSATMPRTKAACEPDYLSSESYHNRFFECKRQMHIAPKILYLLSF